MKVKDLIDQERREWKRELIEYLFLQRDSEEIHKIQICPVPTEDRLIWHYTNSGSFSIRSAYHLGQQFMQRQRAEGLVG